MQIVAYCSRSVTVTCGGLRNCLAKSGSKALDADSVVVYLQLVRAPMLVQDAEQVALSHRCFEPVRVSTSSARCTGISGPVTAQRYTGNCLLASSLPNRRTPRVPEPPARGSAETRSRQTGLPDNRSSSPTMGAKGRRPIFLCIRWG